MTDHDERFRSEILSIVTANPGWTVRVLHEEMDTQTKKREVERDERYRIVAWATVKVWYVDAEPGNEVEPVFLVNGRMIHETEYRRISSDVDPRPGDPKVTVKFTIEAP